MLQPMALQKVGHDWMTEQQYIRMEFREMVLMNPFARQQRRHRHSKQTYGHSGGRRGWDELRE